MKTIGSGWTSCFLGKASLQEYVGSRPVSRQTPNWNRTTRHFASCKIDLVRKRRRNRNLEQSPYRRAISRERGSGGKRFAPCQQRGRSDLIESCSLYRTEIIDSFVAKRTVSGVGPRIAIRHLMGNPIDMRQADGQCQPQSDARHVAAPRHSRQFQVLYRKIAHENRSASATPITPATIQRATRYSAANDRA